MSVPSQGKYKIEKLIFLKTGSNKEYTRLDDVRKFLQSCVDGEGILDYEGDGSIMFSAALFKREVRLTDFATQSMFATLEEQRRQLYLVVH